MAITRVKVSTGELVVIEETQECKQCHKILPLTKDHFAPTVANAISFRRLCKSCEKKNSKDCRERRKNTYMVNKILELQDHKCPSCGADLNKVKWDIDHDHITNKWRGILCHQCNFNLGHYRDNINTLQNLINYLRNPTVNDNGNSMWEQFYDQPT